MMSEATTASTGTLVLRLSCGIADAGGGWNLWTGRGLRR
jgi:hypothetical protein